MSTPGPVQPGSSALLLNSHLHHHASVYKTVASILIIATLHSGLYYIVLCSLQQTWLPATYWFMILRGLCSHIELLHCPTISSFPYFPCFLISIFPISSFPIPPFIPTHQLGWLWISSLLECVSISAQDCTCMEVQAMINVALTGWLGSNNTLHNSWCMWLEFNLQN